MKKLSIFVFILLIVVFAMLWFVKRNKNEVVRDIAGEKVEQLDEVKITFLDIGQGDATFIEFPDGQQMLVDCSQDARVLEALGRVMEYYDKVIDYLLITHPDLDHYGGCQSVLERFDVKNIVYNGLKKEYDSQWQSFWDAREDEGSTYVEIQREEEWHIASTTLHFLYPDHSIVADSHIPGDTKQVDANNTSIVFSLTYASSSILMMGDAEEPLEKYLLATYADQLDSDILKLGHHGSDSSSIQEFITLVSPQHAIASLGVNNKFGHPSRRVLKRLERASSTVWRTDLQGDIRLKMRLNDIKMAVN
ncbi:MAG: MBL fold metallo-hydrolase [Candidatus Magasanikbacteria bacterium]